MELQLTDPYYALKLKARSLYVWSWIRNWI